MKPNCKRSSIMPQVACPSDEESLLALSLGEPVPPELQEHLSSCPSCQARLQELQDTVGALRKAAVKTPASTTIVKPTRPEPVAGAVPASIGKYLVVGRLGQGGQAEVYRALHPELNRELVIKLSGEPVTGGVTERDLLVREGRVLADLEHPGLARVHDLGFHESRPFLVMEYVRGVTLEQHAAERTLPPTQAAMVVAHVARALGTAHRRGVVHQDVKPTNILVDEAGKPRLIDFGLARLRGGWTGVMTQPSGGTAAFMAPEQARAEASRVGPHSDVFALGGVLYFLLTARPPFTGIDWLAAQERAGRCDFDRAALRTAGVPRRLQAICLKAMAAEPAVRYATADELADDLKRFVARPHVLLRWAAAAVVLLALGGAAWFFLHGNNEPAPAANPGTNPGSQDGPSRQRQEENLFAGSFVEQGDFRHPLGSGPLYTGDRLHIDCNLPQDIQHAALFWLDADGALQEVKGAKVSTGQLRFPGKDHTSKLIGSPGTELILVVGGRSGTPNLEEIKAALGTEPLQPLPKGVNAVRLDGKGVHAESDRAPGAEGPSGTTAVTERLEALRKALAPRYEFIAGLAFPHR
jgi:hypothetical protein